MKIVMKNVLDKIDEAIDKYGSDGIIRIEVSNAHFTDLLNVLKDNKHYLIHVVRLNLLSVGVSSVNTIRTRTVPFEVRDRSGSYIVYKGVCVQTHRDYQGFEVIRETIVHKLEKELRGVNKDDVKWIGVSQQEFDDIVESHAQGITKDCEVFTTSIGEVVCKWRGILVRVA